MRYCRKLDAIFEVVKKVCDYPGADVNLGISLGKPVDSVFSIEEDAALKDKYLRLFIKKDLLITSDVRTSAQIQLNRVATELSGVIRNNPVTDYELNYVETLVRSFGAKINYCFYNAKLIGQFMKIDGDFADEMLYELAKAPYVPLDQAAGRPDLKSILELECNESAKKKFILYFCHKCPKDFVIGELEKAEGFNCSDELKGFCAKAIEYTKARESEPLRILFQDVLEDSLENAPKGQPDNQSTSVRTFNKVANISEMMRHIQKNLGNDFIRDFIRKNSGKLIDFIDSVEIYASTELEEPEVFGVKEKCADFF
jgi:hypothetical protein